MSIIYKFTSPITTTGHQLTNISCRGRPSFTTIHQDGYQHDYQHHITTTDRQLTDHIVHSLTQLPFYLPNLVTPQYTHDQTMTVDVSSYTITTTHYHSNSIKRALT